MVLYKVHQPPSSQEHKHTLLPPRESRSNEFIINSIILYGSQPRRAILCSLCTNKQRTAITPTRTPFVFIAGFINNQLGNKERKKETCI